MTAPAALALDRLSLRRGGRTLIRDASATLPPHGFLTLVGPNGAGKSSLIQAMLGWLPYEGGLSILGESAKSAAARHPRHRVRIGLVPQEPAHRRSAPLTVREVAEIGITARRRAGATPPPDTLLDTWLNRLDLAPLADRPYHTLSGGEKRKTHLARVLVQQAELILLDEPTAHLDFTWQARFMDVLRDLWHGGNVAVLMVTHDLHLVPRDLGEVALLGHDGRLRTGPPDRMLDPSSLHEAFAMEGPVR